MATVFIAGHGRMYTNKPTLWVPSGVNIRWAVPPRYQSSGTPKYALQAGRPDVGVSTNILSGAIRTYHQQASGGSPYNEHWLCPDGDNIMAGKGFAFKKKNWGPDCYLLQPRGKCAVRLSNILAFLHRELGTPLDVVWTCCRSPIHGKAIGRKVVNNGQVEDDPEFKPTEASDVVEPGKEGEHTAEQKAANKTSLNLKRHGAPGLDMELTWPGVNTATGGSKAKDLISRMF